jgi:hypothetical protein
MANQIIVTQNGNVQVSIEPTPNVQVQISRAAIGTVTDVPTANFANYAGNVTGANQPNITSLGTLSNLLVSGNTTVNNLTVTGNFVANVAVNTANYANFAGTAFNVSGSNVSGAVANAVYADNAGNATVANSANSVAGANVSGEVANAAYANISGVANSVAGANVSGQVANALVAGTVYTNAQPNITSLGTIIGLTSSGNISAPYFLGNVIGNISGNIVVPGTNTSVLFNQDGNAGASDAFQFNYATNVATITGNLSATNIAGNGAGLSAITGANVTGTVANATYAANAGNATIANSANSVAVGNVSGIGNIAIINLDGNSSNVLFGNGVFAPESTTIANANYANFAGTAFNVSGSNVSGEVANAAYANAANTANLATFATTANSVAGANVSGTVANATFALDAGNSNVANIANSVAVANVSGIGNIATINLDGSSSNVLYGNGVFAPESTSIANANYANFAGTAFNVSGSNVSGEVANANYSTFSGQANTANTANLATYATTANSVAGANVSGEVANANYSSYANIAATANSVAVANVSGIGNIATINLDGNLGNVLYGNGVFAAVVAPTSVANANYANFAGTAFSVSGSNVSGEVANAAYANIAGVANSVAGANVSGEVANAAYANIAAVAYSVSGANVSGEVANAAYANIAGVANSVAGSNVSGEVSFAATANSVAGANVSGTVANATYAANAGNSNLANTANSVAVANVSGIGNIATTNYDGNAGNVLYGNGGFYALPTISNVANANFANYAGNVTVNAQANITSVGTLISLAVTGNVSANAYQLTTTPGTLTPATGQMVWDTASNTVSLGMLNGVTQQIGLESYVLVKASATITDGQVVMFTGANGNHVQAAPADTTSVGFRPEYIIGVATQSIATNDFGYITVFGIVHGLNTNSFNVGDILWVDNTTPGALTATRPTDPNFQIEVAAVTKKSSGDGHLQVRVTPFNNIDSLTDVTITTPTAGQALVYNGSNVWVNGVPAYANTANSVAVANVSGIGNIATINLDGSSSNVLYGNGVFAPESTSIANANYANFAGTVITNAQPNITSVGNLPYLQVSNSANSTGVIRQTSSGNITFTTSAANTATFQITTQYHPNNNVGYPSERTIRSRGNVTNPTAVTNGDRITSRSGHGFNGNTNPISVAETFTIVGLNANANALWTGGQWNITTGNPQGNTANQESLTWQNQLIFTNSGSFQINPATPANTSVGQSTLPVLVTNYGLSTTDLAGAGGFNQQKARGNRDGLLSVQPNDTIGRINMWGHNGTAYQSGRPAALIAQVDSSYVANATVIPLNVSIRTVNSSNVSVDTTFFGNGLASFPGNVSTVGGSLTINKTTGGAPSLSLIGDRTTDSAFNLFDTQFSVSMANVDTTTGFSPFRFQQYAPTNNNFGPMFMYRARGNSFANSAPVVSGDFIYAVNFLVNSNNTTVSTGSFSSQVAYNDNAGNVGTSIILNATGTGTDGYLNGVIDLVANTTFANNFTANSITSTGNLSITGVANIGNLQLNKFQETVYAIGTTSGTITPDLNNGSIQTMTLNGNITLNSLGNAVAGRSMTLIITQDGTGNHTLTSSMLFAGGIKTLSTGANAIDVVSVFYTGSSYYATLSKGYA